MPTLLIDPNKLSCSPTYQNPHRLRPSYRGSYAFYYEIGSDPTDTSNLTKSKVVRITDKFVFLADGRAFYKENRRSTCGRYEIYSMTSPKLVNASIGEY